MTTKNKEKYISFEEFVLNVGLKRETIIKNYKKIPGIKKTDSGFIVLSGTRYPCDLHRYKLKTSGEKKYVLLKTISQYKYISHKELRIEKPQFESMLKELLSAQLIRYNGLTNCYGANAYDCTILGDEILAKKKSVAIKEMLKSIAEVAGIFTGSILSEIYEMTL